MPIEPLLKHTNPFVGLRAFEEDEDYLFFGRSKQIDELLEKLNNNRFLAVIGSSGSGKSSLVKSGLLPAIYSGFMQVGSNWRVAVMKPGENPIGYLTQQLTANNTLYDNNEQSDIPYASIIESSLRRSENGLVQVYKDAHLPPTENLLIVVDQFEELFRFSRYEKENNMGQSDAMHFIQVLLTAAQQKECPIYILLTMRSDFLGDCSTFRGLPEAINSGQYLVPRMKRDEIREAITGPVAVSGATISQRLVTRLLNDVNNDTDQLPILQHALLRTWNAWYERNQPDSPIDFEDYEKVGTMAAALSQHANEAFDELLGEKEKLICEFMFKALTDKPADARGIRRPRSIADICQLTNATNEEVIKVIEVFRKPGRTFLMPPPNIPLSEKSIIDISHESLMRLWDKLIKWVDEEAEAASVYLQLAAANTLYVQKKKDLLDGTELQIALNWYDTFKPLPIWANRYHTGFEDIIGYLLQSKKHRDEKEAARIAKEKEEAENILREKNKRIKRRFKTIASVAGVILASLIFIAVYYKWQNIKVLKARVEALDEKNKASDLLQLVVNGRGKNFSDTEYDAVVERLRHEQTYPIDSLIIPRGYYMRVNNSNEYDYSVWIDVPSFRKDEIEKVNYYFTCPRALDRQYSCEEPSIGYAIGFRARELPCPKINIEVMLTNGEKILFDFPLKASMTIY